ncbi:MAG: CDP-diacylglycerol--glycerol-3-phosphate 3-phosphatidyltransferase [Spirochaetaceae bacterium]|jgi:CDP-diacylglycerol--glycerol-3-phosphate 3-phosphatidyltransferase|nr:CDP-diacylglycerol--glycerol-3-phosphate 3-phosphatidyltransferase [Spirochaetaceae bacterium]GMO18814.1 MAG: hypothetical protein Pg6A_05470 [Termitinemataceae bacterium]
MRLADKFTLVRIIYAPVFIICYLIAQSNEGASLYIIAAITAVLIFAEITDYLDGKTARKLNQVSETGKILDPFADSLLHISIFFGFCYSGDMPPLLFLFVFYREFSMLFLRLYATKKGINIAARLGGKAKTVFYIFTCFWTLAGKLYVRLPLPPLPFAAQMHLIGVCLFSVCVLGAYLSFGEYIYRWVLLNKKH